MSVQVCQGRVWSALSFYACGNRAKVERNGKHYCSVHDPVAKKERDAKRHAERDAHYAQLRAARERATRIAAAERQIIDAVMAYEGELPPFIASARAALYDAQTARADRQRKGE